ncbi:MAG: hypothetical protein AMJ43_10745 [Coxiella sp. DG_40]|nr:MAG: hypothetical protein AMJ43_10745 [Coxiella sp. DG_40]
MKKMKALICLICLLIFFLPKAVFAIGLISDVNSIEKIIYHIETLSSGGIFNLTFRSKLDYSLQPLLAKVPPGYTKSKSWPLLVVLHGLGDGPIIVPQINSMVQIGPFGRGNVWYRGLGEKDIFECIELAEKIFNIHPDRIYLCGFSMGGTGTLELGLKHPDNWAACVPVCGYLDDLELVENGNNLSFWINTGSADKIVPAKYSKQAYQQAVKLGFDHWKYTEYEGMGHSFWIDWKKVEKWLLTQKRTQKPLQVNLSCDKPDKAYWVEITDKIEEKDKAKFTARISSQIIQVKTTNVSGYAIHLDSAPIESSKDLVIIENGKEIFRGSLAKDDIFRRNHQRN